MVNSHCMPSFVVSRHTMMVKTRAGLSNVIKCYVAGFN